MSEDSVKPWLRIGVVTPHPLNDTLPYEFYLMAPAGVMLMTAGLEIADYSTEAVEAQIPVLDRRIDQLMRRGARRIVLNGVPVALLLGRERMRVLLDRISEQWNVPADTDLEAIIAGARSLGVRRIAAATRWQPAVNDRLIAYLAEAGLEAAGLANSGRTMQENAGLDDETGMRLAVELGREVLRGAPDAEGLMMPGSRWITLAAIRELEREFGVPVITNHSASLWAALNSANYRSSIEGRGRLLASLGGN